MKALIRRNAFPMVCSAAVVLTVGSFVIAYRAMSDLPVANQRISLAQVRLQQLGSLRANLAAATSRVRVLKMGGDDQDRLELAEAIARCDQLLGELQTADQPNAPSLLGRIHDDVGDFLELLRSANVARGSVSDDQLLQLRQESKSLRSRLESLEELLRGQFDELRGVLDSKRQGALSALVAGHAVMLAALALLYTARRSEHHRRLAADSKTAEADQRFELLFQSSGDGIIVTDELGRIEVVNVAMAEMLGVSADDLPGQVLTRFFETTVIDEWLANRLDDPSQHPLLLRRVKVKRTDGESLLAEISVKPRTDFGIERLAISVRDVSDQQASRLRLKQHEALLAEIPDPIHVLDAAGRVIYWNRGARQLYGYEASEVIGHTAADLLQIVAPNDHSANVHGSDYDTASRWSGELRATAKDGTRLRIERRRTRLFDDGESIGDVIFDLDLVARTKLQQVERRRQRLESLGALAGGIAHDLNNLLTPILMSGKMLQRDNPNVDRGGLVETIVIGASRGADLISQLLTFARGGDGVHQPIRLQSFLPEIVAIIQRTLPAGIQLQLAIEPDLPDISGDETEVSQVVMNLAINARDAMSETGVLGIEASLMTLVTERSFSYTTLQPGDYVVISVSDTGTGIPVGIRDRIFDPFFSTKPRGQGTGLGLSTSIGIVKGHNGAIGLQSIVGKGTTVSVILPVLPTQEASETSPADARLA
ncbi:PAS domain S-box protein [Stieleria sp. ICT_E10.1]|uniref:PAS domain-containing sensor histidine kinase n=1 Tax=Stieleria sedimenti TaxID=2976331 RepID=UPI0021804CC0|nr:PAS domain S-box protein [Stieleria sedimenti]MCS7468488.1 PAS domain S-box protein [Stieleria sedimenti]